MRALAHAKCRTIVFCWLRGWLESDWSVLGLRLLLGEGGGGDFGMIPPWDLAWTLDP